jgi:hypothetical protein
MTLLPSCRNCAVLPFIAGNQAPFSAKEEQQLKRGTLVLNRDYRETEKLDLLRLNAVSKRAYGKVHADCGGLPGSG